MFYVSNDWFTPKGIFTPPPKKKRVICNKKKVIPAVSILNPHLAVPVEDVLSFSDSAENILLSFFFFY